MPVFFPKLRSMGAFLAVCSGNPYEKSKGVHMQSVGFCEVNVNPQKVYVGGREKAKSEMIIDMLQSQGRRF